MGALAPLLFTMLLKGTVVLATALALAAVLRRASGLARHRLWSLAFSGLLLLPALVTALPPLPLPVPVSLAKLGTALVAAATPAAEPLDGAADAAPGLAESTRTPDDRATADGAQPQQAVRQDTAERATERSISVGNSESMTATSVVGRHAPTTLLAAWLAGVAVGMAFLLAGMARAAWHARRARPVDDKDWVHDLEW
ncbi:MAG: hypothetical protein PVJ51_06205, partial [Acidobacteriota bacterium]